MSVNKVILIGNLGKDPEVRYLDNGVCVATLSVATTEKGYTTQSGQQVADRTEWHDIVTWRGLAQNVEKYLKKGDKVYVEGKLRKRSYEDQNGIKRTVCEVYADTMEFLTPKPNGAGAPPPAVPEEALRQPAAPTPPPAAPVHKRVDISNDGQEDLPF